MNAAAAASSLFTLQVHTVLDAFALGAMGGRIMLSLFIVTYLIIVSCDPVSDAIHSVLSKSSHGLQTLPQHIIKRSLFYGDDTRLKLALHKAYSGQQVRRWEVMPSYKSLTFQHYIPSLQLVISAIGGSVTAGQGLPRKDRRYTERIQSWAETVGLKVKVHNGGFPAIGSSYLAACLSLHVREESDIVIVELALNDPWSYDKIDNPAKREFERLIRKILAMKNKPAVILLNGYQHPSNIPSEHHDKLYLYNAEAYFFDVASFYGLSLASVKAAVWHLSGTRGFWTNSTVWNELQKGGEDADDTPYLFHDNYHYSEHTGHRAMSDLVIGLLLHASRQILIHPKEDTEIDGGIPPLPEIAIWKENNAISTTVESCLVGEPLREAAVETIGYRWVNEAAATNGSKWGWTSLEKDAKLSIKVSTDVDGKASKSQRNVSVAIGFLKSYEKMGQFEARCGGGCICDKLLLDGHDPSRHVSLLEITKFQVSQSPSCIITIGTLKTTSSSGHKVKIGTLVVDGGGGSWSEFGVMETIIQTVSPLQ